MIKLLSIRLNVFTLLLLLLGGFALILIFIMSSLYSSNLNSVRELSNDICGTIIKEKTAQSCQSEAKYLAEKIAAFLRSCETDLEMLADIPVSAEYYLQFSNSRFQKSYSASATIPLYKEIAYIDSTGQEQLRIVDGKMLSQDQLRNIRTIQNTTYKTERYFEQTQNSHSDIFITHLTGWYVSRKEYMEQGKRYNGVIRFCRKIKDSKESFKGIVMIALDHHHLMDFIYPKSDIDLLDYYESGSYSYIFDDEGWIIAHPKLWNLRGLDKDGREMPPLTEQTPPWQLEAGTIPVNLLKLDWRLRDLYTDEPISSMIQRVRRGESVLATIKSLGIFKRKEGLIRTRIYAPIPYNSGPHQKYGVWGGIVIGVALEDLVSNTQPFTRQLDTLNERTKGRMVTLAVVLFGVSIGIACCIAWKISRKFQNLNTRLYQMVKGNYTVPLKKSVIQEMRILTDGIRILGKELQSKKEYLDKNIQELEIVNQKLANTQKESELSWQQDYESESDTILEEKIQSYQIIHPTLKTLREELCIGNSSAFLRVLRQVVPKSQMSIPTWISGESGVGKSQMAKVIHLLSPRSHKPFQIFAASEFSAADPLIVLGKLFGYGPGHGINGIDKNGQRGILENCDGGTLFIDDVDTLPSETQAQLLRVVDGLDFHPAAGQPRKIRVDIRFMFASHLDLEEQVRKGRFRKDLFRRMGGSYNKIEIPPLRQRRMDIPLLARYFLKLYCQRTEAKLTLSESAIKRLQIHDHAEGNIAELKVLVELGCENTRLEGETIIQKKHFPMLSALKESYSDSSDSKADPSLFFSEIEKNKLTILQNNNFQMWKSETELGYKNGSKTLSHHLRGMCLKALAYSDWDVSKAVRAITASSADKSYTTIQNRIERYIENIIQKSAPDQQASLYKNLPALYHSFLEAAIRHYSSL